MKLKELKEKLNSLGDFFDNCAVVIGETWKVAAGVKNAGIAELPPVSWDVSDLAFYITPTTELRKKETPVERPRRTFEEIVKELAEKPEIKGSWNADFDYAERTVLLTNARGFMMHVYDDGDVRFEADIENGSHTDIFTAAQLAAISAACKEIAANYQAAHGKEEA